MVATVVIINISIALALLYAAWQLWHLKLRLVKITNWIIFVDRQAHTLLQQAPEKIYISQQNISHLGHRKQIIESQIQHLQQILRLILWGKQLWGRYSWLIQSK
ncbi:MAG: hypothetical protein QNJ63_03285 [Calothrix sp. MO_192.B10]|nr:hypothetical protein [Calothrix sp. MO_192.B10]